MTSHTVFTIVACSVLTLWGIAFVGYLPPVARRLRVPLGPIAFALGWVVMIGYMAWLWQVLDRVPMRTQGETRLWYTLFLPAIGLVVEWRWRTKTMAIPTIVMAMVFLIITLGHPETLDKSLMPALNSPWFAPHVIVYMVSYATLGVAAALSGWALLQHFFKPGTNLEKTVDEARRLVYIGFPFMTLGMILGAIWGKIAWGHYWSWDPKETWAFMTWAMYLAYLHLDRYTKLSSRAQLMLVTGAFLVLLGCWFGVNALPSAQMSVHTYSAN